MDSSEYKNICSKPNILPKNVLEQTLCVLQRESSKFEGIVLKALSGNPIPVPDKYSGGKEQSYFEVKCSESEAEEITDILFDLEASSVPIDGFATTETYRYVRLVNIWSELTEYVGHRV